jgi:hypothetical protein
LKPTVPPVAHDTRPPSGSVIEMVVLLKLDLMCACPELMFFRSRRRTLSLPFF